MIEKTGIREIVDALSRVEGWLRYQNISSLREVLEHELDEPRKRLAYENTERIRSLRDFADASGGPTGTLPGWWSRWYTVGIVTESPYQKGRMAQICSLRSLGFDLPKTKSQ